MVMYKWEDNYLEYGVQCPACGRNSVRRDKYRISGKDVRREAHCTECWSEWLDIYHKSGGKPLWPRLEVHAMDDIVYESVPDQEVGRCRN